MNIEIFVIACLLGVLACGGTYYYMNKRLLAAQKEVCDAKLAEEKVKLLQNDYEEFVKSSKEKILELKETYKKEADERVEKVISDYEEALKLETENLEEKISDLDTQLGDKIREVTEKNTLYFTCACNRGKQIPCSVDLSSDENYFTCEDCGAVYRIIINASTILMSGITNNQKIANMYDGVNIDEIGERTPL